MKPTPEQIEQIKQLAIATPTEEACGYILDGEVVQARNMAGDRAFTFQCRAPESATCIWHSHLNDADFSVADIKAARSELKPYFLYDLDSGKTQYYDPKVIQPYLGREFHWAWQNCYDLFRDWYRQELKIELPEFYLNKPQSIARRDAGYVANLPLNGFRQVHEDEPIQKHDIILSYESLRFPNHVSIVISPDEAKVIHHLAEELSKVAVLSFDISDRRKKIHSIWRHAKCC